MAACRLETNLVRLLCRCEVLAGSSERDWRLEKYVEALENQLAQLKKHSSKPTPEMLTEYARKVEFLKRLLEAEKLPSPTEKALAGQFLAPGRTPTSSLESTPASKTVYLQATSRFGAEMRSELFGEDSSDITGGDSDLRRRNVQSKDEDGDLGAVLRHHHNLQERLADEMLSLAQNLKHTTMTAQTVIQQDNKTLGESLRASDINYEKLKVESERLERHTKAPNWWIWLMLAIVYFRCFCSWEYTAYFGTLESGIRHRWPVHRSWDLLRRTPLPLFAKEKALMDMFK
uniref:Vesicle transport protein USE1 n=1 Tax=Eptatretus burgeri TaxID=7764 RepID=A0A8C4QVR0_EPTBU